MISSANPRCTCVLGVHVCVCVCVCEREREKEGRRERERESMLMCMYMYRCSTRVGTHACNICACIYVSVQVYFVEFCA